MNGRIMLGIIGILCSCGLAAAASCDLADFDRTAPPSIGLAVRNQFAEFRWASDADLLAGQSRLWHYILNNSPDVGLGGIIWRKAPIRVPLLNPLAPGEAFCQKKFVAAFRDQPDYDAPIIYGTNQQQEEAAVYVAVKSASLPSATVFDTAYLDPQGKKA